VSRSPIFALFSETLDGVSTIRAFSAVKMLRDRMTRLLDNQQQAYFLTFTSQCWLAVRLEFAGTCIIAFTCLCSVFQYPARPGDTVFAGFAGLAISYALQVTQSLNWSVRMSSDLEAYMVSVERVGQYIAMPIEAPRTEQSDKTLDPKWIQMGISNSIL